MTSFLVFQEQKQQTNLYILTVLSFAASDIVQLIVTTNHQFNIHRIILENLSPSLSQCLKGTQVTGSLRYYESRKAVVWHEDVAMIRLVIQFAYTEDYDTPQLKDTEVHLSSTDPKTSYIIWPLGKTASQTSESGIRDLYHRPVEEHVKNMRLLFRTTSYAKTMPYTREKLEYNAYTSKNYSQYSVVFLHHAKVFYFAKLWQISDLAGLAVFKLHQALLSFEPNSQTATEFLKLAQFIYDEVEPEYCADVENSLREIVAHYASCNAYELWRNSEYWEYLGNTPGFARDVFMSRVMTDV